MLGVGCFFLQAYSLTVDGIKNLDSTKATRVSLPDLIDAKYLIDERINVLLNHHANDSSAAMEKWRSLKAVVLGRIANLKVSWPLLHYGLDTSIILSGSLQDLLDLKHIAENQIKNLKTIVPPDLDALAQWHAVRVRVLSRLDYLQVEVPEIHVELDSTHIAAMTSHDLSRAMRVIACQVDALKKAARPDKEALLVWYGKRDRVQARINYLKRHDNNKN